MTVARLSRVLNDLGGTFLEVIQGTPERVTGIGGAVIYDAVDQPVLPPRAIVLGVGVRDAGEVVRALDDLGDRAGALVIRAPVPVDARVRDAVTRSGVVLLGLAAGASWMQLAAMLRTSVAEGHASSGTDTLGGFPVGDLFALANAIAAQLDAPVTIEDPESRVLAFSGQQDEADSSRVQTVLGRQVPRQYARLLSEHGVFDKLYSSAGPIHVDRSTLGVESIAMSRAAIAVRAGAEVLGSIWAAVPGPLSAQRSTALAEAAPLVALHLLRRRAGADVQRRLRADLLSTALEGGPEARAALERLGLADTPVVLLALTVLEPSLDVLSHTDEADQETERQRVGDGFAMHLSAMHPRSAVAAIERVAYGLLPVDGDSAEGEGRAQRIATDFLGRLGRRSRAVIAIGSCASTSAELSDTRAEVHRTLRVLRLGGPNVARFADVHVAVLLLELQDLAVAHGDRFSGPLARLQDYDRLHRTRLTETLAAWLEAFGDVPAAARATAVPTNTFRYRLRRATEVGPIDLADPEARFATMLQLRVLGR